MVKELFFDFDGEKRKIVEVEDNVWEFFFEGMNVPARIFASENIIKPLLNPKQKEWSALRQLYNVSTLPGLEKYVLAMADIHPGYGFPIGGVAAFNIDNGWIMVGGVGFDINCGVRTIKTPLKLEDVIPFKEVLADKLFENVPAGLGRKGFLKLSLDEIDEVLVKGAEFIVNRGFGIKSDLDFIEENGKIEGADPNAVSLKAKQRGLNQIGTLGSGNHYLEVQYVDKIFDTATAEKYGLFEGQIVVSIHCGSRGLGHQVGSDYLKIMSEYMEKNNIKVVDKELVGAPIKSVEGKNYLSAVKAASNAAFANRQMITHLLREVFVDVFNLKPEQVETLYEVAHNTAKIEEHNVNGVFKKVLVHRKGSTRASFNTNDLPEKYKLVGQPVLVGGTMGTSSYILRGTDKAMKYTFGSAIHGAGREKSRVQSKKEYNANSIVKSLSDKGIIVKGHSKSGIAEEAPGAYKDVEEVVNAVHENGINVKVARLKPLIVVKG